MSTPRWAFLALPLITGITALFTSGCSFLQSWQTYSSTPGKYSVSMPGTPKEETQSLPLPDGQTLDLQGALLTLDRTEYAVTFMDFPQATPVSTAQSQTVMTAMIKGVVAQLTDGTIQTEKNLKLNNIPCRDFQAIGQYAAKPVNMTGRLCMQDNRLYQVLARGDQTDKRFDQQAKKFLTSFQIKTQF